MASIASRNSFWIFSSSCAGSRGISNTAHARNRQNFGLRIADCRLGKTVNRKPEICNPQSTSVSDVFCIDALRLIRILGASDNAAPVSEKCDLQIVYVGPQQKLVVLDRPQSREAFGDGFEIDRPGTASPYLNGVAAAQCLRPPLVRPFKELESPLAAGRAPAVEIQLGQVQCRNPRSEERRVGKECE